MTSKTNRPCQVSRNPSIKHFAQECGKGMYTRMSSTTKASARSHSNWASFKKQRRVGSLLMDNDKGEYYRIAAFDAAVHVKTYQTLHSMGVVLNSLRAPRTNVEWAQVQADAEASSEKLKSKRSQYRWPWLLRTYIFAEMRHAGANSLKIIEGWTLLHVMRCTL